MIPRPGQRSRCQGASRPDAPAVSVVIPVYRSESFILRTLDSVFAQSFEAYEILVVDDGSPDNVVDLLAPLSQSGRIRLLRQSNQGMAAARNHGLCHARGEFVAFLDHDDTWPVDKLAWQVRALRDQPDLVMVAGATENVDAHGAALGIYQAPSGDITSQALFRANPIGSPGATLIRTKAAHRVDGFDERVWGADDWDLYLRLAREGRIHIVDRVAIHHLLHQDQAGRDIERMAEAVRFVLEKNLAELPRAERPAAGRQAREGYWQTYGWTHTMKVLRPLRERDLSRTVRALPALWHVRRSLLSDRALWRRLWQKASQRTPALDSRRVAKGQPLSFSKTKSPRRSGQAKIEIALVANENFVQPVEVLILSLLAHHDPAELRVHWFHAELREETRRYIGRSAEAAGLELVFRDYRRLTSGRRWPPERTVLYARLFLPEVLSDLDRLIFLDGDTIVGDSLWPLWNHDLGRHAVGGVRDHWVGGLEFDRLHPRVDAPMRELYSCSTYINAGVLLIDCARWREHDLTAKTVARLEREPDRLYLDQDAINLECRRHIELLDPRWNVHPGIYHYAYRSDCHPAYRKRELQRACARPGVAHYAGGFKPWSGSETWWPLTPLYYRFHRQSRWHVRLPLRSRLRLRWLAALHLLQRMPWLYGRSLSFAKHSKGALAQLFEWSQKRSRTLAPASRPDRPR